MIGTTPTHRFRIPLDTSLLEKARIVYKQKKAEVLRKETDQITFDGNTISVDLTQEETFLFDHREPVVFQLRVKDKSGKVWKSPEYTKRVTECLDLEVL